ncbi:MAG: hypothetical protein JJE40_05710 [Vicinamibacteria bacterium]|nr:hypothetical protein [Vicinamibacteria bacterium]
MDLIERYLHAVKTHLPLEQQGDVVAELGEDLRSRIEARESELGRPLDESEVVAVLKAVGHPGRLAAGYGPWQQLIGRALFPMYIHILKIALGLALLVNVVVAAVLFATGHSVGESLRGLIAFPFLTAILVFGWVTIVFAIIDAKVGPAVLKDARSSLKTLLGEDWDPRDLPPAPRHQSSVPLWQVVLDLVGAVLLLAWWLAVPSHPFLLFGPGAAFLSPGPGLLASYLPVAMLAAVAVVARVIALWPPRRAVLGLVCRVLGVVGVAVVWWIGGPYIVPAMANPPADLAKAMIWIERTVTVSLVVVTIITVVDLIKDVWRFRRARRPPAVAATASTRPGSPR